MSNKSDKKKKAPPTTLRETRAVKREVDRELDLVERRIEELKTLYEQHFIDVLPQPPVKLRAEVVRELKRLLKAPFKQSSSKFRLRALIHRFQTYSTYWERVMKEREDGKYSKDLFKAEFREKAAQDAAKESSGGHRAEKGLRDLYSTYESAVKKSGAGAGGMDFDQFKRSLMKKAKELKEKHGVKKLNYKVVVKDGKVVVKASAK